MLVVPPALVAVLVMPPAPAPASPPVAVDEPPTALLDGPVVLLEQAAPEADAPITAASKIPLSNQDLLNARVFMRKNLPEG